MVARFCGVARGGGGVYTPNGRDDETLCKEAVRMGGQLGLGVMIQMMGGNEGTAQAVRDSIGLTIKKLELVEDSFGDNALLFSFEDGSVLKLWDGGQSCCEHRYMNTDDDLDYHVGAELMKVELRDAPDEEDQYGVHEVQFLVITTSKGAFTMANHNEHNGYYGGFWIKAERSAANA